jgi:hypothetical protein
MEALSGCRIYDIPAVSQLSSKAQIRPKTKLPHARSVSIGVFARLQLQAFASGLTKIESFERLDYAFLELSRVSKAESERGPRKEK